MDKKLAEVEKGCTFAPAITAKFLRFIEGRELVKKIKFFSRKACRKEKSELPLRPARAEVHWKFAQAVKGKRE